MRRIAWHGHRGQHPAAARSPGVQPPGSERKPLPGYNPQVRNDARNCGAFSWRMALWRGLLALVRRPALVLALAVTGILLASAVSEAAAANQLAAQMRAAQATNAALRVQLTQVAAEVRDHETTSAIIIAARRLGWALPGSAMP
jgi:hypothetical protein